jgi:hypothetical protein
MRDIRAGTSSVCWMLVWQCLYHEERHFTLTTERKPPIVMVLLLLLLLLSSSGMAAVGAGCGMYTSSVARLLVDIDAQHSLPRDLSFSLLSLRIVSPSRRARILSRLSLASRLGIVGRP